MELVRKMDAGPVLSRLEVPINDGETAGELETRLAAAGAAELAQDLPAWLAGDLQAVPQDEALATYCHILKKEDGWLRREMSAEEAERAVRAYNPWPGAFVVDGANRLSIWGASVLADPPGELPGAFRLVAGRPGIAFRDGWLMLEEVQKPGGKPLSSQQYLAGARGQLPSSVVLA
jgi:methionyl-tRNA formyltransferase